VSTGYNGPARGFPHCGDTKSWTVSKTDIEKLTDIDKLTDQVPGNIIFTKDPHYLQPTSICPRRAKGYKSGEGLVECPAAHAEGNCIANAARLGVSTVGAVLYMNSIIPCKDCAIILVNAGVSTVVVDTLTPYHKMSLDIFSYGNIKLRSFDL